MHIQCMVVSDTMTSKVALCYNGRQHRYVGVQYVQYIAMCYNDKSGVGSFCSPLDVSSVWLRHLEEAGSEEVWSSLEWTALFARESCLWDSEWGWRRREE